MSADSPATRLDAVEAADMASVAEMAERTWRVAYRDIITPAQIDYMLALMYSPGALRRDREEGRVRYRWIVGNGERIGFLAFDSTRPGERVALHKCYVLREAQGRGHGSRALELVAGELAAEGAAGVELRVNRHNDAAIAFYRRNGFSVEREDCLDIGGGFVMDDFVMVRPLPPGDTNG